jgi:arylsulfatase A-like enzyme
MSEGSPDATPRLLSTRVAPMFSVLLGGAAVAVLATGLCLAVETRGHAGLLPWSFAVGTLATWSSLIALMLAVPCAWLVPGLAQPAPARPRGRAALYVLGCVAGTYVLSLGLRGPLEALVPRSLAYRADIAIVLSAYAGALLCVALLAAIVRLRRGALPPLYIALPALLSARLLAAPHVLETIGRHGPLYELTVLALLSFAAVHLVRELSNAVRSALTAFALAASLLFVVSVGSLDEQRAAFFDRYRSTGRLLFQLALLFDFDRDGVPSILGGTDCDDFDERVGPQCLEIVGNGVDDNCRGGDLPSASPLPEPVRATAAPARNVIFVTLDAARADVLTARHMPRLAALSGSAAVFERAYANSTNTLESLLSLSSGQYPMAIQLGFGGFVGSDVTLAEHFQALGYHTLLALQPDFAREPWYGERGYSEVDRRLAPANVGERGITSAETTRQAIAHVQRLTAAGKPFFAWFHYYDMHEQYMPRGGTPFGGDSTEARYFQETWSVDRDVGQLLDFLAQSGFFAREGLLVIHGDHGELIGERGRTGHCIYMDEAVLRVPLIIKGPGVVPGRYATRVNLVDLYPTVLDVAASVRAASFGRHLERVWSGRDPRDEPVFASSFCQGSNIGVAIIDHYKLLEDAAVGASFVYDLGKDPGEQHNLADQLPEVRAELRKRLGQMWDASMNDQVLARRIAQRRTQ